MLKGFREENVTAQQGLNSSCRLFQQNFDRSLITWLLKNVRVLQEHPESSEQEVPVYGRDAVQSSNHCVQFTCSG